MSSVRGSVSVQKCGCGRVRWGVECEFVVGRIL